MIEEFVSTQSEKEYRNILQEHEKMCGLNSFRYANAFLTYKTKPDDFTRWSSELLNLLEFMVIHMYKEGVEENLEKAEKIYRDREEVKRESAQKIREELRIAEKIFNAVPETAFVLGWIIRHVQIEDLWLGDMEVSINTELNKVHVELLDEDNASHLGNPHPHVSEDGTMCLGEGMIIIPKLIKKHKYSMVIDTINEMLEKYNPHEAYLKIEDWEGFLCPQCKNQVSTEDEKSCAYCGLSLCENCIEDELCEDCHHGCCSQCDNVLSRFVLHTECNCCDNKLCMECTNSCENCKEPVCAEHMHYGDLCEDCFVGICHKCHKGISTYDDGWKEVDTPSGISIYYCEDCINDE